MNFSMHWIACSGFNLIQTAAIVFQLKEVKLILMTRIIDVSRYLWF
jgi:hypothetical protein